MRSGNNPYPRTILVYIALSCALTHAIAQSYGELVHQADSCFKIGEYDNSMKFYSQAFAIKSTVPRDLYNAACSAALGGQSHFAMAWVKLAVDNGWTNISHLESDADLRSLHGLPEWAQVTNDLRNKREEIESKYDRALQQELLAIYDTDQSPRRQYSYYKRLIPEQTAKADSMYRIIRRTDSLNVIKVTGILDKHGWVGNELVGDRAMDAISMVMHHADLKTALKYLPLLKEAVDRKTLPPVYLALMEDRIAVGEGREQLYGSQIGYNEETKQYYVMALKDPEDVDKRREAVGLGPMSDFTRMYGFKWDPNSKSK
ncbi:DUF6624 domain-containing protein [Chryseolinea sp. T2]|uniref:DUF6624 domain-containing protein n=1 Tax=Chryseolinea sp. T2 TaxID=3129255 RepID=UPI00307749A9